MATVNLTAREIATILAALRTWQANIDTPEDFKAMTEDNEHFPDEEVAPLNVNEIDELCERINRK